MPTPSPDHSLLIIAASRGLGLAMVQEYLSRGWSVVATQRSGARSGLHDLLGTSEGRLEIESVDINHPDQIVALKQRLGSRRFGVLFVNAGVMTSERETTIADISTDEFLQQMTTNALSPMRVVESLQDLVVPTGTIALMSTGAASVANNEQGGLEVYRASKTALNMLMRSYAARHRNEARALLLMAPGWVRTHMGGPDAPLEISDSIPHLVATIMAQEGKPGLQFLDYRGGTVKW
jgi:NAD(P)-dependent dehydrogenase (short-subunit alcohol dehydrogenase family)